MVNKCCDNECSTVDEMLEHHLLDVAPPVIHICKGCILCKEDDSKEERTI